MTQVRNKILEVGLDLKTHQSSGHIVCPHCNGGGTNEKSFVVTRIPDGLLYVCHRAACMYRGFIPSRGACDVALEKRETPRKPTEPWRGLWPMELAYFASVFDIDADHCGFMYGLHSKRVYMPVLNIYGYPLGFVARAYPDLGCDAKPKALTYKENLYYPWAHYSHDINLFSDTVIVTEDILSAEKVKGVALMGTSMAPQVAAELANNFNRLVLWLDSNAHMAALSIKKKYSLLFNDVRIILYNGHDPKNLTHTHIQDILNEYGIKHTMCQPTAAELRHTARDSKERILVR